MHFIVSTVLSVFVVVSCYVILTNLVNEADKEPESGRIVTDLEIIHGNFGVPVEYWYNETREDDQVNYLTSSPGCPKSIEGFPWIYYGNPAKCFLAYYKGPCPTAYKLIPQEDNIYGACVCECLAEHENSTQLLTNSDRYLFCTESDLASFEQVYDKQQKKCYNMYKRGPCAKGTVLAKVSANSITCLPICDNSKDNWWKLAENELCFQIPAVLKASAISVLGNKCTGGQTYSEVLRKCVKRVQLRSG